MAPRKQKKATVFRQKSIKKGDKTRKRHKGGKVDMKAAAVNKMQAEEAAAAARQAQAEAARQAQAEAARQAEARQVEAQSVLGDLNTDPHGRRGGKRSRKHRKTKK
jgi:hypothetical protein